MMRIFKALKYAGLFTVTILSFIACDEEFNTIDSKVLGEENFNFNNAVWEAPIISYNKTLGPLQVNNLSSNLLGFYNDPNYGETTASFVTQATLGSTTSNFGTNPKIESVILSIPYFSEATGEFEADNETPIYVLDSLYETSNDASIKLTIYRNNYYLRDFNPISSTNTSQNFYSNAFNDDDVNNYIQTENSVINIDGLADEMLYQNNNFSFNANAIETSTDDADTKTFTSPGIRVDLADDDTKKAFWKALILDKAGEPELSNSNNFKNYFRGLYFKAETNGSHGQMILLNTNSSEAQITINYSNDNEDDTSSTGSYILNLSGTAINRVNTFINNFNTTLPDGNPDDGDETLYLKGIEGSMAIIDLFKGSVTDCIETAPLECFKKTYRQLNENGYVLKSGESIDENGYIKKNGDFVLKRLINEAQLIIYEDQNIENPDSHTSDRLYIYDVKNNIPVVDYFTDITENTSSPLNSRVISLGQRLIDTDNRYKYKIRITEHLNNILINDSTNTRLGLVLSKNVNITNNSVLLNVNPIDGVTEIPSASILSPNGTVLHGSQSPDETRMRLEIFFTESESQSN